MQVGAAVRCARSGTPPTAGYVGDRLSATRMAGHGHAAAH